MRRVCIFCETWESGGIESFLYNALLHMDLTNLEVEIVAVRLNKSIFTGELEKKGVRFFCLSGSTRNLYQNCVGFSKLLRQRKYDVAHFNLFQGLSLGYICLAKREGVPIRIAHSHNTALRQSALKWLKVIVHRIASVMFSGDATELWACSQAAAEFLFSTKALCKLGFTFIPNGIDTKRFRFDQQQREMVREQLGLQNCFVVGNIGRLCQQKNQAFLLDIFSILIKKKPESRLLLVGGGNKQELVTKAERLQISNQVIFYSVSNKVEHLLWAMDVFVFPSLFEGLPVTLVEAQAAGLPIICSDNITKEAHITSLIHSHSLSEGAGQWAQATLEWCPRLPRQQVASTVRQAGFDIAEASEQMERCYRGG